MRGQENPSNFEPLQFEQNLLTLSFSLNDFPCSKDTPKVLEVVTGIPSCHHKGGGYKVVGCSAVHHDHHRNVLDRPPSFFWFVALVHKVSERLWLG